MKKFALTNETKKDNQSVYTYVCENDTITFMMHPTEAFRFIIEASNMTKKAYNNFLESWMVHAMDESTKTFAEKIQSITVI
jgi:hypothetical protein